MADLQTQLENYRLTTAKILYHLPDYPKLLQEYVWQEYDLVPKFPELHKFLDFWQDTLEGQLHSVYVASSEIITPSDAAFYDFEITIQ